MENGVLRQNERILRLSLDFNAFDFLKKYREFDFDSFKSFIDLKIAIITLVSFFELFIKWIICTENREDIWLRSTKRNVKSFNNDDFESGNFHSISLSKCLNIAVEKKWISQKEKETILRIDEIRNCIVHYEICGNVKLFGGNSLLLTKSLFVEADKSIVSLIKHNYQKLSKNLKIEYKEIIDFYMK